MEDKRQIDEPLRGLSAIAGELTNPITLFFVALLLVNDWILKPSSWFPRFIAGKLSDIAGLVFFPLALTALFSCVALIVQAFGFRCSPILNKQRLLWAILMVAIVFTAIKLSRPCAFMLENILSIVFPAPKIVVDATDLFCLPFLGLSWVIGEKSMTLCRET